MTEISAAPESLAKLVWQYDKRIFAPPASVVVGNFDEEINEQYDDPLTAQNPFTTGENVHIVERYLLEATRASKNEVQSKWSRFVARIAEEHYTRAQIRKVIHNLDKKKQYSALHYAVWHNNIYLVEKLLDRKSKFSSDVNILSGYGEHVLHIIAQSKAIWNAELSNDRESPVQVIHAKSNSNKTFVSRRSTQARVEPQGSSSNVPKVVELLLHRCRKVDREDNEKRTPLHLAVLLNRPIYVAILLRAGANSSAQSTLQDNIFHQISLSSCSSIDKDRMFDLLINHPGVDLSLLTRKNLEGLTPFSLAIAHGTSHMIDRMVSKIDIGSLGDELPILIDMIAKRSSDFPEKLLERLLLQHYQPGRYFNLLHIICHYNNPKLLQYTLDYIQTRSKTNNQELLETTDEHGYTPLLIAAYYGHQPMIDFLLDRKAKYLHVMTHEKKNLVHLIAQRQHRHVLERLLTKLPPNDLIILMTSQPFQGTPLHEICRTPNVQFCQLMLTKYTGDLIKLFTHQNADGKTIYHIACEYGRLEMIKFLTSDQLIPNRTNKIRLLAIADDERQTCLHLAAAGGHADVVAYLLQSQLVNINAVTDKCETAFHYACRNGHRSVVIELLTNECDTLLRNAQLYNGLELAILHHNEDVARLLLLENRGWRPMLQNAQIVLDSGGDAYDTPLRKLIRYMPVLAIDVIDEQFTRTSGAENMPVDKQIYDYEFFEDQLTVKRWYTKNVSPDLVKNGARARCCGCFTYRSGYESYTGDAYTLVRNHPLFIISESQNQPLMEHSFCQALRAKKYSQFGRYLLVLSFILYLLYLIAFTSIMLRTKHPQYFYELVNETSFTDDLCESVANRLVNFDIREALKDTTYRNLKTGVYVFLVMFIVKNTILILTLFPRVFRKGSYYLEGAALILAFVNILDLPDWLDPLAFRCPVKYQIGAFALLLSWINFLVYIRCIPVIGIYVVMLQVISKKFVRFLPVLLVLIGGFGLTYYVLLQNQDVYATPVLALIKTSLIMFEMNFDDRIYDEKSGGINYYPVTFVVFILTGYVMTIFVINLLIGLAVGEIPTLVTQGALLQSSIYYDNLSDYEILRLQIRSVIFWLMSHICCCCPSSIKLRFYRWIDRSFLGQRPILFQIDDRNRRSPPKRIARVIKEKFLNEQIHESVDEEVKNRVEKKRQTRNQRAKDDEYREQKELAYLQSKMRTN